MFNICTACGEYSALGDIRKGQPLSYLQCSHCQSWRPFVQLPLIQLTGASGSGKSTLLPLLIERLPEINIIELDLLWRDGHSKTKAGAHEDLTAALRVVKSLAQGGRMSALLGAVSPDALAVNNETRFFSEVLTIGLYCQPTILQQRLLTRAAWRAPRPAQIQQHLDFNEQLRRQCQANQWALVDNSQNPRLAADCVSRWIRTYANDCW